MKSQGGEGHPTNNKSKEFYLDWTHFLLELPSKVVYSRRIEGRVKVMGGCGRRCKQLLDNHREKRGYWKLKAEALGRTVWRTQFGLGYGSLIQ
jgi:hypothetical protein